MQNIDFKLIKTLSEAFGISGREKEVRDIIVSEIEPYCDEIRVDSLGNLIARKNGVGNDILLTAAMDEPGFIITKIKEGGGAFLDFDPVGAVKPHSVISQAVAVGDKKLPGIISLKAVHLTTMEEREKPPALKDLFIDIGADTKTDAEAIMLGDYAVFDSKFEELGNSKILGKSIARSACCGILCALLKSDDVHGITCVFTAQNQAGNRGSKLSFGIDEVEFGEAVVLDTLEDERVGRGDGVAVPGMVGETCVDRKVADKLAAAAGDKNKPFAKKNSTSDIAGISIKGSGIRCAELDIPIRNKNTASEIADKGDIEAAYQTLYKYIIER